MRRFSWCLLVTLFLPHVAMSMNPLRPGCWIELLGRSIRNAELPKFHDGRLLTSLRAYGNFAPSQVAYLTRAGMAVGEVPRSSKPCDDPAVIAEMPQALKNRTLFFQTLLARIASLSEFDRDNKFFYMTTPDFWALFLNENFINTLQPPGTDVMLASWNASRPMVRVPYLAAPALFALLKNRDSLFETLRGELDGTIQKLSALRAEMAILSGVWWGPDDLRRQASSFPSHVVSLLEGMLVNGHPISFNLSGSLPALVARFEREAGVRRTGARWPSTDSIAASFLESTAQTTSLSLSDLGWDDAPPSTGGNATAHRLGWSIALAAATRTIRQAGIHSANLLYVASQHVEEFRELPTELLLHSMNDYRDLPGSLDRLGHTLQNAVAEFFVARLALARSGFSSSIDIQREIDFALRTLLPGADVSFDPENALDVLSSGTFADRVAAAISLQDSIERVLARHLSDAEQIEKARFKLVLACGYWDAAFRQLRYQLLGGRALHQESLRLSPLVEAHLHNDALVDSLPVPAAQVVTLAGQGFLPAAAYARYPASRFTANPGRLYGLFQEDLYAPTRDAMTLGESLGPVVMPRWDLKDLASSDPAGQKLRTQIDELVRPHARVPFSTP